MWLFEKLARWGWLGERNEGFVIVVGALDYVCEQRPFNNGAAALLLDRLKELS